MKTLIEIFSTFFTSYSYASSKLTFKDLPVILFALIIAGIIAMPMYSGIVKISGSEDVAYFGTLVLGCIVYVLMVKLTRHIIAKAKQNNHNDRISR